jgi:DNA-binding transcriptional LysR family regulator
VDRLEAMAIVLKVVEKGGFSAASRELGVPLATVSRKVGELEQHLGTRLLVRTTRKLALTDAGASYVAAARRILDEVEEAERAAAGEFQVARGELIVTAPVLFGRLHVLPLVSEFLAAHPAISVRLLLSDRNLHLVDDHVDVAVRLGPLPDSASIAARVGAMRTVVCASPMLLARQRAPESPEALAQWPCVNFDVMSPAAVWSFRSQGKHRTEVAIRPRLSVSTAEAAVWAAAEGVGVTRVLHYQCADALRDRALRIILAEFEVEPLPVHVLHAGGNVPMKTRLFLDFVISRLRRRLALLSAPRERAAKRTIRGSR